MSRKTSSRSSNSASPVTSASKTAVKTKTRATLSTLEKPKPFPAPAKPPAKTASSAKPQQVPASTVVKVHPAPPAPAAKPLGPPPTQMPGMPAGSPPKPKAPVDDEAASQVLTRAERDITSAIDSLNNQMNAALAALAQLASAQVERGKAVVRTAPLDRATATFHRLVSEVVDDQLAEMLPPLISLRNELKQWQTGSEAGSPEAELYHRGVETLDGVLGTAGVTQYDPPPGQTFDPLIHLAVGEAHNAELPDGSVAQCIQPGFRSARGKVLTPARVRINRR